MPGADAHAVDLAGLRKALDDVTREAGELAQRMRRAGLKSWTKGGSSPVTDADIASNDLVRARLKTLNPDFGWLSEENDDDVARLGKPFTWIVDPIDGTRAFLAGRDDWCVSIALVADDAPILAAIFAPATDEFFSAQRGMGTTRNGRPIHAADGETLDVARMAGPKYLIERLVQAPEGLEPHPRIGSLALRLCRVADARLDVAFAGGHCRDWDIAAADLIVGEAGGKLTSLADETIRYNQRDVTHDDLVAAGQRRHRGIIARLSTGTA